MPARRRARYGWIALALILCCTTSAEAQRRFFPRGGNGLGGRVSLQWNAPAPRPTSYANPYEYYRQVYPKYRGGFHARELDNIGIPTGDIGLRGNGMFWSPW